MEKPIQIFSSQASNATSEATKVVSQGREMTLFASGTFGSGTLKVEVSPDQGTTWVDTPVSTSLTAAGSKSFTVAKGAHVRLNLSGATAPSLNAWLGYTES